MSRTVTASRRDRVLVEAPEFQSANGASIDVARDLFFDVEPLREYALARWNPIIRDLMVLAAAVEFADCVVSRKTSRWKRLLHVRIPVQDPIRWLAPEVAATLSAALCKLTGDDWSFSFVSRKDDHYAPTIIYLNLDLPTDAVMAFSSGLDSLAVAGIIGSQLGDKLLCVRVQRGAPGPNRIGRRFETVPYKIKYRDWQKKESSGRTRAFKFLVTSAVGAYLSGADKIIVPESGQSALGTALAPLGNLYPHFGSHPAFLARMELFLKELLGSALCIEIPRLWYTKGQTVAEYLELCPAGEWVKTRSCWKPSYLSSVNGRRRQCGVCAACILRRVSIHAAGLAEPAETYASEELNANTLEASVPQAFRSSRACGDAFKADAIAGIRSMSEFASMVHAGNGQRLRRYAIELGRTLGLGTDKASQRLVALVCQHESEWSAFLHSLDHNSFVRRWAA